MVEAMTTPNFQEKAKKAIAEAKIFGCDWEEWLEDSIYKALRSSYLDGLRRGARIVRKRSAYSESAESIMDEILAEVEKVEKEK